jgi:transcriptional regulator with XRE-family HTH domain
MSVPSRIRNLRREKGLTLDALATTVGIHKGHLSRIESGEKSPSLATLEAIAKALKVGMAELFGEKASAQEITVVRQAERIPTGDPKTYLVEALIAGSSSRPLASYIVVPGRTFPDHDVPDHAGQEFLYVLKGKVEVAVADQLITLNTGDCATYDAALQHKLRKLGSADAKVLVVLGKN